jgi:hypothetical protein
LRELEADFHSPEPDWKTVDLRQATQIAAESFRSTHPDISDDAVAALAGCYTWDWK